MKHTQVTADQLWEALEKHDSAHDIIQAGSNAGSDTNTSATGIVLGHAYVVVGVVKLSTGDRLVKLRNPHGRDSYKGDWSDDSSKWTSELRVEAGSTSDKDDGIIFLTVEDYLKEFSDTMVNKNMENVHQDYFLMLGDDGSKASQGSTRFEGNTKHELTITSEVDQTVKVSVNVWEDRGFPSKCLDYSKTSHVAEYPWSMFYHTWRYGSQDSPEVEMKAGEKHVIQVEFNWKDANTPKDWSVVAMGYAGKVSVKHNDANAVTAKMPLVEAKSGDGSSDGSSGGSPPS